MTKRSRTREARQRRQKQRRQNRRLVLVVAVVIVAVVAAAMLIVSNQPVDVFVPSGLAERYDSLSRSLSVAGYPQLGSQDAPVTVEEYASFSCPGCEALHSESFDAILERVRAGQILFTYIPLQTGSIPNAAGAARTALCAGQQGMFWEMHDVLFDWHTRYVNTAFSQNRLLAGVNALGLNSDAFTTCFNSGAISNTLTAAQNEDVAATPTVQVNGVTVAATQAGAIPSSADILRAIDDATPNDWGTEPEPPPASDDSDSNAEQESPPEDDSAASSDEADRPPASDDSDSNTEQESPPEDDSAASSDEADRPPASDDSDSSAEQESPSEDDSSETEATATPAS